MQRSVKRSIQPDERAPIVAITIIQIAALVLRAYLDIRLAENGYSKSFSKDLSYLIVPPILLVLMYPILRQHGVFLLSLLRCQDLTLRLILWSVLLGFTLRMTYWTGLISLVSFGALRNPDPKAITDPVISFGCPEPGVLTLSIVVVSLVTPAFEEVINRGLILPSLLHRGKIAAVVITSVLFAVMHNSQSISLAFIIGLFLGAQMTNYKSLWAPLITHATYNVMTVFDWECLHTRWNPTETTPAMIGTGLITTGLAALGVYLCVLLAMNKNIGANERPDVRSC
jgi:membrane protease YdiL (CAAX protease family)